MNCEQEEKTFIPYELIEPTETLKPRNTFQRAVNTLKHLFTAAPSSSSNPLNNEERRAFRAHMLEAERAKATAIQYIRYNSEH